MPILSRAQPDATWDYPPGTVLGEWPMNLGDLELDRVDVAGVQWSVTEFNGWGSPAPTGDMLDRASGHGATAATWWRQAKELTIAGAVDAPTAQDRWNAEQRLLTAASTIDTPLVVLEETPRLQTVRLNGQLEVVRPTTFGFEFEIPLIALDPLRYSTQPRWDATGLPSVVGGWSFPRTFPLWRNAVTTSGELHAPNAGTTTAWPTYTIYGPIANPRIANPQTGAVMNLTAELNVGEWLVLDAETHQVLMFGESTANRRSWFWGQWWGLAPGSNTVRFGGVNRSPTGTSVEPTLRIEYRDVWL